jgi:3-deoxy-D-manno-octulosonic acid kinase
MNSLRDYTEGRYRIVSRQALDRHQRRQLGHMLETAPASSGVILAGRRSAAIISLGTIGPVAIKSFGRGGLIRHAVRDTYVNWPRTRAEKEFRWLETVRRMGVSAPRPIAFASSGRLVGRCWLVTAAIAGQRSLIQVAEAGGGAAIYSQVRAQIEILLRQGVWHRDLHPGNVLVDDRGTVYLIDFDKARHLRHRRLLQWLYKRRWLRAIAKHNLAPELARLVS